jgi:hypothetical protein
MRITKNDLSYDEAKVDFEALLRTAHCAVHSILENISKKLDVVRNETFKMDKSIDITALHLNALWLSQEATELVICAETLATLIGAKTRTNIWIVNKPEVPDKGE